MAKRRGFGSDQNDELPKAKLNKVALKETRRLFGHIGPHRWKLYLGLFFLLLTGATALLFPMLLGKLVKTIENKDFESINRIGILLIAVLTGQAICSYFRVYLFVNYTENTLAVLRRAVYMHLISLPMTFFVQQRVGDLNSRMSADIAQIQDTLTTTIAEFLRQVILVIGGITLLVIISPKLTMMMLAIVPVVAVVAVIFGRFIRKTSRQVQENVAESNTIIEETLQGIANVKAFANEFFENNRYEKSTEQIVKVAIKGGQHRGVFASFVIFCLFGAIVAVIWYGVVLASRGQLLIGDLISFILYSAFVGASFGGIAELYAQIQKAVGAVERVFEILDEPAENVSLQHNTNIPRINGNVVFKQVAFTYPSRKEISVLNDISFEASKGETIAVVGPSGSGKSTLVSLLLRFYEPESGVIMIDGKPASAYPLSDLRNNMAIVPQDVLLFGGTIKENIAYGKPNATDSEIMEAAAKANALQFIEKFPEQFNTVVGERGVKLSGGQRQRIAIARAVLKDPAILILDEATSSLDSESERLVQEAFVDQLMQGRTSFVIAHRLSTIRNANKIIVIDGGVVVESGTHESLMQKEGGLYQSLSKLQTQMHHP